MVFSSVEFLFLFLPATLLIYFLSLLTKSIRFSNYALLIASLFFYFWGSGPITLLLLFVVFSTYFLGNGIIRYKTNRYRLAKWLLILSVSLNLIVLGYFKYANFFVEEINRLLSLTGVEQFGWTHVALPIGISFFIFQAISYSVDIWRGDAEKAKSLGKFALYIALFPQLIAGPIVRYHLVAEALNMRNHSVERFSAGAARFTHGLFKKVVIADPMGRIADLAFADPGQLTLGESWLGLMAYTVQIYFDFSGYSDMAIGIGRMLGFNFPENFARPYSSSSVTEFWRRWHMTLSNFFRDYVYIPLGGNRAGVFRTYFNLSFVFLVTGLWHGANWTFVVWGLFHGGLLIGERLLGVRESGNAYFIPFRRLLTFLLVIIGWVVFRADTIGDAGLYYKALIDFSNTGLDFNFHSAMDHSTWLAMIVGLLSLLIPKTWVTGIWVENFVTGQSGLGLTQLLRPAYVLLALLACFIAVNTSLHSPFLYFQF